MDSWKRGLLQLADEVVSGAATAGITFGFLADGREIVEFVPGEGLVTAVFSDHDDEGWPGFELRLPEGFVLQHAFFGVLRRHIALMAPRPLSRVREEFETLAGVDLVPRVDGGRAWHATLDGGIDVTLMGTERASSLALRQPRDPSSIGDALHNRVLRFKEDLEAAWSASDDEETGAD